VRTAWLPAVTVRVAQILSLVAGELLNGRVALTEMFETKLLLKSFLSWADAVMAWRQ
jgi:hypothetical protein